ncbi:bifunctional (p)ppGpp synthetase/guanosine-3',5'-bis(diphosphate) 3'-pyrophosphohydrolase [bacterium]|nr:bifunctional (p)ppGpp synthetase/guanosine-3',5'-bis(diphosphate) 3'-pyrophosphohydrolase [bacterium]TLN13670.1 MAG: bifunctional (p)ppGpp synthetase/guanosine-3',5'-bis(diphosphate) 3'-pyrophosphohydrolase [bacterium]
MGPRFQRALAYAAQLHIDQVRKDSLTPYIAHLLATTSLVLEYGGNEDEAIAALLHDALEDQPNDGQTRAEIETQFGAGVLAIVQACSDTQVHPKPPWRERKEAFLKTLAYISPSACLVIAADKLHNTRTLAREFREHGEAIWQRFNGGRAGTLWFSRTLLAALQARNCLPAALLGELSSAVAELESLVASRANLV